MDELALWLYGTKVAKVWQVRNRLRLQYTDEAHAKYDPGTPVLSFGLPLTVEHYTDVPVRAFIDGLLPEGSPRDALAREFGLKRDDTFGLIRELGRDCAGAIVIQPDQDPAPAPATVAAADPLDEAEIAALVAKLPEAPLGVDGDVRLSLAGVQDKLVLTRLPSGDWGRPVNSAPSTHLLKPGMERFPGIVENEAFCMRFAHHVGLPAAKVDIAILDRKLLVVERFDRRLHADGSLDRVHQEDFCQAFLRLPAEKYEESGGPSLHAIAGLLLAATSMDELETLLRAVTVNLLIGNCDAHAKNFSLVHEESGIVRFAPLYDLVSTLYYAGLDRKLAMYIDSVQRIERVTSSRLVSEAVSWGMPRVRVENAIRDVIARAPEAIAAAQADVPDVMPDLPDLVRRQIAQLESE